MRKIVIAIIATTLASFFSTPADAEIRYRRRWNGADFYDRQSGSHIGRLYVRPNGDWRFRDSRRIDIHENNRRIWEDWERSQRWNTPQRKW